MSSPARSSPFPGPGGAPRQGFYLGTTLGLEDLSSRASLLHPPNPRLAHTEAPSLHPRGASPYALSAVRVQAMSAAPFVPVPEDLSRQYV
jgi:hypothetical protein